MLVLFKFKSEVINGDIPEIKTLYTYKGVGYEHIVDALNSLFNDTFVLSGTSWRGLPMYVGEKSIIVVDESESLVKFPLIGEKVGNKKYKIAGTGEIIEFD